MLSFVSGVEKELRKNLRRKKKIQRIESAFRPIYQKLSGVEDLYGAEGNEMKEFPSDTSRE